MKKHNFTLLIRAFWLVILTILFSSCVPYFTIDFDIENYSGERIQIIMSLEHYSRTDTISLDNNSKETIDRLTDKNEEYFDDLSVLPFDTLLIVNEQGVRFDKNTLEVFSWVKVYIDSGDEGKMVLRVYEDDFN